MGAAQDRQDVHEMRVELSIRQWDRVVTAFLLGARKARDFADDWVFALGLYDLVTDSLVVRAIPHAPPSGFGHPDAEHKIMVSAHAVWPAAKDGRWEGVTRVFITAMEEFAREQPP